MLIYWFNFWLLMHFAAANQETLVPKEDIYIHLGVMHITLISARPFNLMILLDIYGMQNTNQLKKSIF